MGVKLSDILPKESVLKIDLKQLSGKVIAFDAHNMLYQFLAIIRGMDGRPLMDSKNRVTSHLSGLFFRTINFMQFGILPVFVFDGRPPDLKRATVNRRVEARRQAASLYAQHLESGQMDEARKYAQRAASLSEHILKSSKNLLDLLGIPWVQAPSEGEAQAAYLAIKRDASASASQDMDSMLFGSPTLIRNLSIVGRRKLPGRNAYVEVDPEMMHLTQVLRGLEISRENLVDIGILVGTDYAEGVKGVGPKKALKLVREHGSAEKTLKALGVEVSFSIEEVRELFLRPSVTDQYTLARRKPEYDAVLRFLVDEYDFSHERVSKALEELKAAEMKFEKRTSLDSWVT